MATEHTLEQPTAGRAGFDGLVGRAGLLADVEQRLRADECVALTGPRGIGKSTLLDSLHQSARDRGEFVLRASGTGNEHRIPYSGVADLLTAVPAAYLDELPRPQLAAVNSVLRRDDALGLGEELRFGCCLAWHQLLRQCAKDRPTLVLVDEAHGLDPDSADVIAYAARRLTGFPARIVLAGRFHESVSGDGPNAPWLPERWCTELVVPPLAPDELAELLEAHELPARTATKLHAESGGNPQLALSLCAAQTNTAARHDSVMPLPRNLHSMIVSRFTGLPECSRETVLFAALADSPSIELLLRAGRQDAERDIRLAAEAGLVTESHGVVNFIPSTARDVIAESAAGQHRAAVHRSLTEVVTDPAERARHNALASSGPCGRVSRSLVDAASEAVGQGNRGLAGELYLLAAQRAPSELNGERLDWLVAAAESAAAGMRKPIVHRAAESILAGDSTAAQRVRVRIALIDLSGQAMSEMDELFTAALLDAGGDAGLMAPLYLRRGWAALIDGTPQRGAAEAERAATLAHQAGDPTTEAMALAMRATAYRALGRTDYQATMDRALRLPHEPLGGWSHLSPRFLATRFAVFDDDLEHARAELLALLAVAGQGTGEDVAEILRSLAEVAARTGRCAEALDYAQRALRHSERAGLSPGPCWYDVAVAELAGGSLAKAAAYARRGLRACEQESDSIYLIKHLHVLGQVKLREGDAHGATRTLRRVQRIESEQGISAPLVHRWHADLATALASTGEPDEAVEVTTAARRALSHEHAAGGVNAALDRSEALVAAARGENETAIEILARACDTFRALGQPLEHGYCMLVEAQIQRRRRRYSAAREAAGTALNIFATHGARPWVEQTRRMLALVDGADEQDPAGPLEVLTEAEERIATLVGEGASNQEAAARLYLSVKTIEASLTRVYRKLGIRSRTQLGSLLRGR